jgi:hypothetical protein
MQISRATLAVRQQNRCDNKEDTDMKLGFIFAALLGLSATSAIADCTYHQASASTDRQEKTGSIQSEKQQNQASLADSKTQSSE